MLIHFRIHTWRSYHNYFASRSIQSWFIILYLIYICAIFNLIHNIPKHWQFGHLYQLLSFLRIQFFSPCCNDFLGFYFNIVHVCLCHFPDPVFNKTSCCRSQNMGNSYFRAKEDDDNEGDGYAYRPSSVCYLLSYLRHQSSWSGVPNEFFACQLIHMCSQDISSTNFYKQKSLSTIIYSV